MSNAVSPNLKYAAVAGLGALAGGLLVALAARVLPRAVSRAMAGMMEQMMGQMGEGRPGLPDT